LALGAAPNSRVLDACAAPGGKSFTVAQLTGDSGELMACDIHEARVGLIAARQKKMRIKSVKPVVCDITSPGVLPGLFDYILCDVPCSGLGAIRRKPELKRRFAENLAEIASLPGLQYKILVAASQYLKAGGRLVYSTCTLNPAENEEIAARFLSENPGFAAASLPERLGGGASRTIIGEMDADGFFIAAIKKSEDYGA
jgi:16S rRNA (cytosine967-C5)-methyltransferase